MLNCQFRPVNGDNGTPTAVKTLKISLLMLLAIVFNFVGVNYQGGSDSMMKELMSGVLICSSSLFISYAAGALPLA